MSVFEAHALTPLDYSGLAGVIEMDRYREKDRVLTSKAYTNSWYWPQLGRYAYTPITTLAPSGSSVTRMYDVNTPTFFRERNKGRIICSPMFKEELSYSCDHSIATLTGTDYGKQAIHLNSHSLGLSAIPASELAFSQFREEYDKFERENALAIMRAHSKVDLSEINLWASVGELPETIAWIRSLATRIRDITRLFMRKSESLKILRTLTYNANKSIGKDSFRRLESYMRLLEARKLRNKSKDLISAQSLWLEYRYAVRPLIADIENCIAVIDKVLEDKRYTARGHEYNKGENVSIQSFNNYPTGLEFSCRVKVTEKSSIRGRAGCLYFVDTHVSSLLDILGIDQPIEGAYELIPFSFVLDWVFSLGDYLNGIFKSSGLSILTSWSVLKVEATRQCTVLEANYNSSDPKIIWPDQRFVLGSSFQGISRKWRYINPQFPNLPQFDLKVNLAKLIDLGAISKQMLGGKSLNVAKRS